MRQRKNRDTVHVFRMKPYHDCVAQGDTGHLTQLTNDAELDEVVVAVMMANSPAQKERNALHRVNN